jgi:hypothetical protein
MFPLDGGKRVVDDAENGFMGSEVVLTSDGEEKMAREGIVRMVLDGEGGIGNGKVVVENFNDAGAVVGVDERGTEVRKERVGEFSRLWAYRGGRVPED